MITIRKLAERFGLSRSTLLYYDRIGLLSPHARTQAGYRLYGEESVARLHLIMTYKNAGLTLKEVQALLRKPETPDCDIIRSRVVELDQEISMLRVQQRTLVSILKRSGDAGPTSSIGKKEWVSILRSSGMDEEDMQCWHVQFERNAPDAHHAFLRWLGISEDEALHIRKSSKIRTVRRSKRKRGGALPE
jgi:DNA-binding transcriptional MerR regulator